MSISHGNGQPNEKGHAQFPNPIKSKDEFPALFEKAREAMGLNQSINAFSNDVLRIEITGPAYPQLTIVDLPGLIHSESKAQTAKDVVLVSRLVKSYMANPRSIILAVVSAKNDFVNQVVLKRAREIDSDGLRTLGIITKPDQLKSGSDDEASFLGLARNEEFRFKLGWHVVKNQDLSTGKCDADRRDAEEAEYVVSVRSNLNRFPEFKILYPDLSARVTYTLWSRRSKIELGPKQRLGTFTDEIWIGFSVTVTSTPCQPVISG